MNLLTPIHNALEASFAHPVVSASIEEGVLGQFNPITTIRFGLPSSAFVHLNIYTIDGKYVTTLVNGQIKAGNHEIIWNGRDERGQLVASGTYFYRIEAGPFTETRRMVLIK